MSTEEAHRFELLLDIECDRWLLLDTWTESKLHLDEGAWELHLDEEAGHAFVANEASESLCCMVLFDIVVSPHPQTNELYVLLEDGASTLLETFKQKHRPLEVPIMVPGHAEACVIKAFLLHLPCGGAFVWWGLADLYKTFIASSLPPHRWYQNWWQWWCKTVASVGLDSSIHLRKPVPVGQPPTGELCHRIFPEASASSYALILLLCRFSNNSKSRAGQQKKSHQDDWLLVFKGFLMTFVEKEEKMEWSFFLDRNMAVRPGLPLCGANRVQLVVEQGCIDVSPLCPCDDIRVTQCVDSLDGIDTSKPVPLWQWCLALERAGTKCLWLWQQVVWYLGALIEGKTMDTLDEKPDSESDNKDNAAVSDFLVSR